MQAEASQTCIRIVSVYKYDYKIMYYTMQYNMQVESSQTCIRIVGLSATLPTYRSATGGRGAGNGGASERPQGPRK